MGHLAPEDSTLAADEQEPGVTDTKFVFTYRRVLGLLRTDTLSAGHLSGIKACRSYPEMTVFKKLLKFASVETHL